MSLRRGSLITVNLSNASGVNSSRETGFKAEKRGDSPVNNRRGPDISFFFQIPTCFFISTEKKNSNIKILKNKKKEDLLF
jgi:hypothetical protein